jgi:hypothetical protein
MFHHSIYILILYYILNIFSLQSGIHLETAGTAFLPVDMNALLLGNWSVATTVACVFKCHNNFECRTFNFDSTTNQCQLFEGDKMATGSMIGAPSSAFIAGSIDLSEPDFENYNKSCDQCEDTRFLRCVNGQCGCQQHTYWNGTMCLPQSPMPCTECQQNMDMCRLDIGLACQSYNKCDCKFTVYVRI